MVNRKVRNGYATHLNTERKHGERSVSVSCGILVLMLTRLRHQTASNFATCRDRSTYRTHMCGLCHALGDEYALLSRLLTLQETILLNLLVSAQREEAPGNATRRCPLNPTRKVNTNQDIASQFAAAV